MDEMALDILGHPFLLEAFIPTPQGSIPHAASI